MMDAATMRLECLRLAVQFGSARTAADPAELAGRYAAFVAGEPERRVTRKNKEDGGGNASPGAAEGAAPRTPRTGGN